MTTSVPAVSNSKDAQTAASDATTASIQVKFFTRGNQHQVPATPILVPSKLARNGLSHVINHLLAYEHPVNFDFLVNGKFLRSTLDKYLLVNQISIETTVEIEYIEAVSAPTLSRTFEHDDWISCVSMHPQRPHVLTGSYDGRARLYNTSGQCIATLSRHTHAVKSVAFVSDEDEVVQVVSGGMDSVVCGWSIENKVAKVMYEAKGHSGSVGSISVNASGSHFATGSVDKSVIVWTCDTEDVDVETNEDAQVVGKKKRKLQPSGTPIKRPLAALEGHIGAVSAVEFHGQDAPSILYSCSWDHSIKLWDIEAQSNIATMTCDKVIQDLSHAAATSTNLLATGHADGLIRIWDSRLPSSTKHIADASVVKLKLAGHSAYSVVSRVQWASVGLYNLASAGLDGHLRVWDIRSTTPLFSLPVGDVLPHTVHGTNAVDQQRSKLLALDWQQDMLVSGGEDKQLRFHQHSLQQ